MAPKAMELFEAYSQNKLPTKGGYIVSSFFDTKSTYTRLEVISYNNVKAIFYNGRELTFQSDGRKIFILIEPASYPKKYEEPFRRSKEESIPHRFSELDIYTSRNQTKVMVSKEPVISYGSFTVMKPEANNFSFIFFLNENITDVLNEFFIDLINKETKISRHDATEGTEKIIESIKKI